MNNKYIDNKLKAFRKEFEWEFREISQNPAHKNLFLWIEQFIKEALEQQAEEYELLIIQLKP